MRKTSREWELILDLIQVKESIKNKNQRAFVENLYQLLDEFSPFLEQQSEDQLDYLYSLYKKYVGEIPNGENKGTLRSNL